jgi:hypothetical protein
VTYDQQTYVEINDAPAVTLDQLLGNIGSAMGLFIGASLITIIEFM